MSPSISELIHELAELDATPAEAARTALHGISVLFNDAVASGVMANVKQLADDLARHADSLSAAIGGGANAAEPAVLSRKHDDVSPPTDPETFEV